MNGRVIFILVAMLIGAFEVSAYSQSYPTKPVMLMVAWPAGGSTDVGARILVSIAEKDLGQSIVVINKAGAGGQVGFTELAKQKPDGYYIGFINLPQINTIILDPERKATFTIDSFTPIINQVLDPGVIYVKPDSPYKNLKDLVDEAKKRPGEIKAGVSGLLSDDHMAILMLEQAARIKFRIIVFDGDSPHVTALLGGQIDAGFMNVGGIMPRVKAGQLRALAVLEKERSRFYPDVRTSGEQGYPTLISSSTRGIVGPKGLREPIVKKLQAVFMKGIKDPEHMDKMEKAGLAIKPMLGEEYAKYFRELHDRTRPLVDAARRDR